MLRHVAALGGGSWLGVGVGCGVWGVEEVVNQGPNERLQPEAILREAAAVAAVAAVAAAAS